MIRASMRDLRWRRRRFVLAVVGTALVFSLTMLLGALRDNFISEIDRTLDGLGADHYLVSDQSVGPFRGFVPVPASVADGLAEPVRGRSGPIVLVRQPIVVDDEVVDVNVFGHRIAALGQPPVVDGRAVEAPGEIVVDRSTGLDLGDEATVAGKGSIVVGRSNGLTLGAGSPNVYLPLQDVQDRVLGGQPLATMILVESDTPPAVPAGITLTSRDNAADNLIEPFRSAVTSLTLLTFLLWVVASLIVGSSLYLTAIERTRDFAVFRATGTTTRNLAIGLGAQALALTMTAGVLSIGLATLMAPLFPLGLVITGSSMALVIVASCGVGLIASVAGLRRAVRVQPALAFGGAQ